MNNPILLSLITRGKEPSTWAAVGPALGGLGFVVPSQWMQVISFFGMGVCCLLGIILPEQKSVPPHSLHS